MIQVNILCGPTASGKSSVGQLIANTLRAEILSIDSMKLYRGLDIGTAKPSAEIFNSIPHHLINVREPWEGFSVAEFIDSAERIIADCNRRQVPLIGEGGTALYLKTLAEGLFSGPGRNAEIRADLEKEAERVGTPALHERLTKIDPDAAKKILPGDLRRIIRALEVHAMTGQPISRHQTQWGKPRTDLDVRMACLRLPRDVLYARIDRRIDQMLSDGWADECKKLLTLPHPLSREASQALGYRTLFAHLRGETTLKDARDRICFDTHHFARRQLNWFRRIPKLTFIDISERTPVDEIASRVQEIWAKPIG